MKKIISFFLISFFISFSVLFCQAMPAGEEKSFMWQLNFAENQSYILGSIHFLKKNMYPLKPEIEKAFASTDVLAVEADISAGKMAGYMKMTMEKSMYQGDETLEKNLSETTFDLARETLQKFGIDIQFYQKFKPWFLALTISGLEVMKLGYDPNFGVDKYFIDRVYAGDDKTGTVKKEIYELEGIEYQINLFEAFNREESEYFLLGTLQEVTGYETEIDDMVNAWQTGNVSAMEQILELNRTGSPELAPIYKKIIDERNRQMAEKVMNWLKSEKTCFIVVGAGHLIGKNGMIKLLSNQGIRVKQI
jgi:uncharacterized protein YbaP (TraB family)